MFITRYMVQWIYGHSGFNEMTIVGRVLSALVDLFSVVLVYAIGSRLFNKAVGLLAAAFAAFTVLEYSAVPFLHHGHILQLLYPAGGLFCRQGEPGGA